MIPSEGSIAALHASGEFDPDFYLHTYPDVRETGLDPAAHFLWMGARLGRLGKRPSSLFDRPADGRLDVLFVDGTNGTSSTPYRVSRVAEGLSKFGLKVRCIRGDQLPKSTDQPIGARFVTFFRAPLWEHFRTFAERMRANGSRIVFDIDDLVFDEELIPIIDGYRLLTEPEKLGYVRGVRAYRAFLLFADICTAPTDFLADQMRALGKKAYRVRNSLARSEMENFANRDQVRSGKGFVVGYYSGSKTHQADFRHAGEALVQFMKECPSAEFRLVGQFDLGEFPELEKWSHGDGAAARVKRVELLPHSKMLEDQLECDVIIAPLEVGNPFCEAKSELKFFEAALARRPVIASPTRTFCQATQNGRFAQLANGPDDWLQAFHRSFREAGLISRDVGQAREYVVHEYSPEAAGSDAVRAYCEVLGAVHFPPNPQSSAVANSNSIR